MIGLLSWVRKISRAARNRVISCRNARRLPPLNAFWDAIALPCLVFGPVALSQGFQQWTATDCLALRSGVQLLFIALLQYFDRRSFGLLRARR